MKGVRSIINLSLVLLIIGVFPSLVLAHGNHGEDSATAEAAAGGDQQAMKDFVAHAKAHLDKAVANETPGAAIDNVVRFRAETREAGTWKHESTYLIQIEKSGSIINHGEHTATLYGDFINRFPTVESLILKLKDSNGAPVCEMNANNTYSCAAYYTSPFNDSIQNIVIGGFSHDDDDPRIGELACNDYEPIVTAKDLQEMQDGGVSEDVLKENLKFLVKDAIRWVESRPSPGMAKEDLETDILSSVRCFTKESKDNRGPWKYKSIYFFVMTHDSFVAVNGSNQELTGSRFIGVLDEDNKNIGELIIDKAGEDGNEGFVEYLWDDPTDTDDGVTECHNAPDPCAPGNSPKISYVEGKTFSNFTGQQDTVFIFGSGIYPEPEMEEQSSDSDDGCAIAGSQDTAENTLFNLLLIVSGLFLAMSWRKNRSAGKA